MRGIILNVEHKLSLADSLTFRLLELLVRSSGYTVITTFVLSEVIIFIRYRLDTLDTFIRRLQGLQRGINR